MKLISIICLLALLILLTGCAGVDVEDNGDVDDNDSADVDDNHGENPLDADNSTVNQTGPVYTDKYNETEDIVDCPPELIDKEYTFIWGYTSQYGTRLAGGYFSENDNQEICDPPKCLQGSQVGENINYYYCDPFVYIGQSQIDAAGNILGGPQEYRVNLVLEASRVEDRINTKYPNCPYCSDWGEGGPSFGGKCTIPYQTDNLTYGNWTYFRAVSLTCTERKIKVPRDELGRVLARGGCPEGKCWSNGACCSAASKYSCLGTCSSTEEESRNKNKMKCGGSYTVICEGDVPDYSGYGTDDDYAYDSDDGGNGGTVIQQYCNSGYCYSGGYCCPSSKRYYCNGYCYDATGANNAGCWSLKSTCY